MIIEIYADNLSQEDIANKTRRSARALVLADDKLLLLHARKIDVYMSPGGGIEPGETPEQAALRELLEETGYKGEIIRKTLVIKEYFSEENWETHYFLVKADLNKKSDRKLTEEEINQDITEHWLSVSEALTLFDSHESAFLHADNIQQREFIAIINSL